MTRPYRPVTVAPGVDLTVHDTGHRGGPAVVLLHGLASTHRWWDVVADQLPARRVVRFDHRGHGQSATPPRGYTIAQFTADTAAVLDALDVGRCIVAGHSLGAAVALDVATHRPDQVVGVCLVDGGVYDPHLLFGTSWWEARYQMLLDRRIAPTPSMLTAWARGTGLPAAAVPALLANYRPATGRDAAGPVRLRLAVDHEIAAARSLWCHKPAALLPRLHAPAVAVLARPTDPARAATVLRAVLHTFDRAGRTLPVQWVDGGHDLPLEHPAAIVAAISHLAALDAAATQSGAAA
jgi:pimeloyl-ACP methyl ester carboxylesterase